MQTPQALRPSLNLLNTAWRKGGAAARQRNSGEGWKSSKWALHKLFFRPASAVPFWEEPVTQVSEFPGL